MKRSRKLQMWKLNQSLQGILFFTIICSFRRKLGSRVTGDNDTYAWLKVRLHLQLTVKVSQRVKSKRMNGKNERKISGLCCDNHNCCRHRKFEWLTRKQTQWTSAGATSDNTDLATVWNSLSHDELRRRRIALFPQIAYKEHHYLPWL